MEKAEAVSSIGSCLQDRVDDIRIVVELMAQEER